MERLRNQDDECATLPSSRGEAREIGSIRYFTGRPCKNGHLAERFTSTGQCSDCLADHSAKWSANNRDKVRVMQSNWLKKKRSERREPVKKVPEPRSLINRRYYLKKRGFPNANLSIECIPIDKKTRQEIYNHLNKEKISSIRGRYRKANKEFIKSLWKEWYSKNRVLQVARSHIRRKAISIATPWWLTESNRSEILEIYRMAGEQRAAGNDVHVDHIVPLRGEFVCGLHVPLNLQIIPASENLRKKNTFTS